MLLIACPCTFFYTYCYSNLPYSPSIYVEKLLPKRPVLLYMRGLIYGGLYGIRNSQQKWLNVSRGEQPLELYSMHSKVIAKRGAL